MVGQMLQQNAPGIWSRAEHCKETFQEGVHVRRENLIKVSPSIYAYLEGFSLKGAVVDWVRDDHLKAPPQKKTKATPRIQ